MSRRRRDALGWNAFGGYLAAKKTKLNLQYKLPRGSLLSSNIFHGVSIYVNGYTDPSSDVLKEMITSNGGRYHHYFTKSEVTHMIASNLPQGKLKSLANVKVVYPTWITESIRCGRLLPWTQFRLTIVKETTSDQELNQSLFIQTDKNAVEPSESADNSLILFPSETPSTSTDLAGPSNVSPPHKVISSIPKSNEAKTGNDEGFIGEFYAHSRLHHLSTWATDLRDFVSEEKDLIQSNHEKTGCSLYPLRKKLLTWLTEQLDESENTNVSSDFKPNNLIMHIDLDCFFVSVGLKSRPEYIGQPVAVCHSKGRMPPGSLDQKKQDDRVKERQLFETKFGTTRAGAKLPVDQALSYAEIASCSYEARQFGLKNGMLLGRAKELCPQLQIIPYDFDAYTSVSKAFYTTILGLSHEIEVVSCDELYLDCTELVSFVSDSFSSTSTPTTVVSLTQIVKGIRHLVSTSTGCPVSCGIASNLLLARMATKRAKPNGQYICSDDPIHFLSSFPLKDFPGIGWAISQRFTEMKIATCADLQALSLSKLQSEFGPKKGENLFHLCRGQDNRQLQLNKVRKSVSAEINYGLRFETRENVLNFLKKLAKEVESRLLKAKVVGRTITMKLMIRHPDAPKETMKFLGHGLCNTVNRSQNLPSAINQAELVYKHAVNLLDFIKPAYDDIRGMGIHVSRLETQGVGCQKTLSSFFSTTTKKTEIVPQIEKRKVLHSVDLDEDTNNHSINQTEAFFKKPHPPTKKFPVSTNRAQCCSSDSSYQPVNNAENLPAFSMIDKAVYDSLPTSIRAEFDMAYAAKQKSSCSSPNKAVFKSPGKNTRAPRRAAPVNKAKATTSQATLHEHFIVMHKQAASQSLEDAEKRAKFMTKSSMADPQVVKMQLSEYFANDAPPDSSIKTLTVDLLLPFVANDHGLVEDCLIYLKSHLPEWKRSSPVYSEWLEIFRNIFDEIDNEMVKRHGARLWIRKLCYEFIDEETK